MRNPLRSEAEAFRFVIITLAAFAVIAIAAALLGWIAGVLVFIAVTAAAFYYYYRTPSGEEAVRETPAVHPPDEYRLLVVANETVAGQALVDEVTRIAGEHGNATVLVVAPALLDRKHLWTSDVDPARADAQARLDVGVAELVEAGIAATGTVGAHDPLVAFDDAYRTFGPDEAIISTGSPGHSSWLEQGVVEQARERFDVPITHVIVEEVQ
jgi:GABA permease